MAAKVRSINGAWWVVTHHRGKRTKKRVGTKKAHKREAEQIARVINQRLASGQFQSGVIKPLPCGEMVREWHIAYAATMKPSYEVLTAGLIRNHLIPFFGDRDLRAIKESDLLAFARVKLADGLAPKTIRNALAIIRRVFYLAQREGLVERNPATRIGELMRQVHRRVAEGAEEVDAWRRGEVETLLRVAKAHEPRFSPLLGLLFATGMRRGEALGLQWADVDFDHREIAVRRAIVRGQLTTPKSGRSRKIQMPATLASNLFDLLSDRRQETLRRGWREVPKYIFCSEAGTALDERNVTRVWERVRRRAQKQGVRPLKLHSTRHTWATFALHAGKSVRWVADQLGHSDPALTLRVYAHAIREEETDLSFAEFGGPGRPYTAPGSDENDTESLNYLESLARREGLEPPTLRFEA